MKAVLLALLSAILWGSAPLLFKLGLRGEVPPLVGIFYHNLTATLLSLLSILLIKESLLYPAKYIVLISLGGLVSGFLGLLLYYKAIKIGEVSVVAPVAATSPLWASLLAFLMLGESFSLLKLVGSLLVVLGVILITISR